MTQSDVWFTIAHGIVNEVWYQTMDCANTRDFDFVVTSDDWSGRIPSL